jgi:hypothetical protein
MKSFASSMQKFAQDGMVAQPSPAQIYAAKKAENEYLAELKRQSPAGYAKAIAGSITAPLLLPSLFSLSSLNEDRVNRHINSVYISEALQRRFEFDPKKSQGIAAAIVNSAYSNPITEDVSARLVNLKFDLAKDIANNSAPGVDKKRGERIVADAESVIQQHLNREGLGEAVVNKTPAQRFNTFDRYLDTFNKSLHKEIEGYPQFRPEIPHSFNADYAMALRELGEGIYERRTGRKLTSASAAINLVSKAIGNSMKAGIPLAAISGGLAIARHRKTTRAFRDTQQEGRRPPSVWGEV